jgi:hypothetical protein
MIWQDAAIATAQAVFVLALLPTAFGNRGLPPLATSIPTALCLGVIAIAMASLDLVYSAVTAATCAFLWVLIAIRKGGLR